MRIQDIALVRIPNPKLRLLMRMAKTLVRDAPAEQNLPIEAALAKLVAEIVNIDDALSRRARLKNPHLIARELAFDRAVDSLWVFLRSHLESCAHAFGHVGLDHLSPDRQAALDLGELRELAATAASIHEQLFAAEGTGFIKLALPDQAEVMATFLRIIEQDGLKAGIQRVFGERILDALVVCRAEYEELVSFRMRREAGVDVDLSASRRRLRWLLSRYKSAVETLYDEDKPETEAVVHNSLRALLVVSALMSRGRGRLPRRRARRRAGRGRAPRRG